MINFFNKAKVGDIIVFPNNITYMDEWRESKWVITGKKGFDGNYGNELYVKLLYKNNNRNYFNNLYIGCTHTFRNLGNDIELISIRKSKLPSWF